MRTIFRCKVRKNHHQNEKKMPKRGSNIEAFLRKSSMPFPKLAFDANSFPVSYQYLAMVELAIRRFSVVDGALSPSSTGATRRQSTLSQVRVEVDYCQAYIFWVATALRDISPDFMSKIWCCIFADPDRGEQCRDAEGSDEGGARDLQAAHPQP